MMNRTRVHSEPAFRSLWREQGTWDTMAPWLPGSAVQSVRSITAPRLGTRTLLPGLAFISLTKQHSQTSLRGFGYWRRVRDIRSASSWCPASA